MTAILNWLLLGLSAFAAGMSGLGALVALFRRHMLTARSLSVIAVLYLALFVTVRLHGVIRDLWTVLALLAVVLLLGTYVLLGWVMATRPREDE